MTQFARATDPTPEEIEKQCRQIRDGWSAEERLRRLRVDWRPTFVRADNQRVEFDVETYNEHHGAHAELQGV